MYTHTPQEGLNPHFLPYVVGMLVAGCILLHFSGVLMACRKKKKKKKDTYNV